MNIPSFPLLRRWLGLLAVAVTALLPATTASASSQVGEVTGQVILGDVAGVRAEISTPGERDRYEFSAPTPGWYTVELFDADLSLRGELLDGSGAPASWTSGGPVGRVQRYLELYVAVPAEYTVLVGSGYAEETGEYSVRVLPQWDRGWTRDAQQEPNNTFWTSFPLTRGQILDTTLDPGHPGTPVYGDVDWFTFPVVPGKEHFVYVTADGFVPHMGVFSSVSTTVGAGSDPWCDGTTCEVSFVPDGAGPHHVRVGRDFEGSGSYSVCVRAVGEECANSIHAVQRLAGKDRYETAARVAAEFHRRGVEVAYLASGANFPDALAGAALAGAHDAPVLLTRPDSLPRETLSMLHALSPGRVVILGSTGAVSEKVADQLRAATWFRGAPTVTRIAGSDRFATAARISSTVAPGVATAYVATGAAFPDALSGAALAGSSGSPLLLVRQDGIPGSVAEELARLRPQRIVVLGGPGAVSDEVIRELSRHARATTGKVTRIAGPDRYATSALVASKFPKGVSDVYVATGSSFPDALAAAARAGARHSPLLLSRPTAMPDAVVEAVLDVRAARGFVVGAQGVVADAVATQLRSALR